MLHTKFRGNRPAGSREDFLKSFYHIWAWPSWSCDQHLSSHFHFLVLESFHTKFVSDNTIVSEKIRFEFLYVHDLGPRSRNDLDLQYSHIFIKSICLRSLAAIVSEKSTVFTFSYRKA